MVKQPKKQRFSKQKLPTKSELVTKLNRSKFKNKNLEISKNLPKKLGINFLKLSNSKNDENKLLLTQNETSNNSVRLKKKIGKQKPKFKQNSSSGRIFDLKTKSLKGIVQATLKENKDDEKKKLIMNQKKKKRYDNSNSARPTSKENYIQSPKSKKPTKLTGKYSDRKIVPQSGKNIDAFRSASESTVKRKEKLTLRDRMMTKLKASRFRYLNEQIYSVESKEAQKLFTDDPQSFEAYHEGYRQQVKRWPINPVDVIIENIQKMPKNYIIADFGCGDAKISKSVQQQVHSFDLVASNQHVRACDMARVPLKKESVNVVVFCLSLMGVNLHDYLREANRVLKIGGIMKIAEVESRFDDVEEFIKGVQHFGFKNTWKDSSHNLFYFFDFNKTTNIKKSRTLPTLSLHPCLYKKR